MKTPVYIVDHILAMKNKELVILMTSPIEKACEYIISRAYPSYNKDTCGYCARAVRKAVDFGFEKNIKQVVAAKDYGPSYEAIGFRKVFSYPLVNKDNYKPMIGDICIIQYEPYGHICMFTVKGWISDFVQRDMYGGSIRNKNPKFDILRYA